MTKHCACRVDSGGECKTKRKASIMGSSGDHTGTIAMSKDLDVLLSRAEPFKLGGHKPFWSERVTHLLLNRYRILNDDCIDLHSDANPCYHETDPILSFSYGAGGVFPLQQKFPSRNKTKTKSEPLEAAVYMKPGDVLIMYGKFQASMLHGVPPFKEWKSWVDKMKREDKTKAEAEQKRLEETSTSQEPHRQDESTRWNGTVRFIANHFQVCPLNEQVAGPERSATISQQPAASAKPKSATPVTVIQTKQVTPRGSVANEVNMGDNLKRPRATSSNVESQIRDQIIAEIQRECDEALARKDAQIQEMERCEFGKDAQIQEMQRSEVGFQNLFEQIFELIRILPVGDYEDSIQSVRKIKTDLECQCS
ncbi:unnamed protein product [Polarella glacialis]|uniref:Fe2OG dioxygenase domain-containing protein n=1 Tax=Polarella glacialis TaxID=89957 RepID=A0A813I8D1_POLGL|nr:unnamed protein product [Polarella glacialis]